MGQILTRYPFDGTTTTNAMSARLNSLYRTDTEVRNIVSKWCDISVGVSNVEMTLKSSNLSSSKLYQLIASDTAVGMQSYLQTTTVNPNKYTSYSNGGAYLAVDLDKNNPAIYFIDSEYGFGIGVGTCKPLIGVLKGHTIDGAERNVMFRTQNYVSRHAPAPQPINLRLHRRQ